MDLDVEAEAAWLLGAFDEPVSAERLIRSHLGPAAVVSVPGLRGARAYLATVDGKPRIAVRHGLSAVERRWPLLHELAEWHLGQVGYREPDVETVAERLTAALLVPRDLYRDALRRHGERWAKLARDFAATQTCVALRLGETTGRPLAVVTPALVRVRGDEFAWPDEPRLRKAAESRKRIPGLRKARLTDDRRRLVLVG